MDLSGNQNSFLKILVSVSVDLQLQSPVGWFSLKILWASPPLDSLDIRPHEHFVGHASRHDLPS